MPDDNINPEAASTSAPSQPVGQSPIPSRLTESAMVLVVDDDPWQAQTRSRMFESAGATTVAVTGASEALAAVADQQYDLVVVDINLSGEVGDRSGVALARAIHEQDTDLPIVAASSYYEELAPDDSAIFRAQHLKGSSVAKLNEWRARCLELLAEHYVIRTDSNAIDSQ